jgi:hypothetical protein
MKRSIPSSDSNVNKHSSTDESASTTGVMLPSSRNDELTMINKQTQMEHLILKKRSRHRKMETRRKTMMKIVK